MKHIILKNGFIAGAIASGSILITSYIFKVNPDLFESTYFIGIIAMLLAFLFVILGIMHYRKANNGIISFGKALSIGLLISLMASTLYVVTWLLVYKNYFPDFMEQYAKLELSHAKPEELAAKTAEMNQYKEMYKSDLMVILLTYMEIFPVGILVSLLSAAILRKKTNFT
jgi:hypothetical protein